MVPPPRNNYTRMLRCFLVISQHFPLAVQDSICPLCLHIWPKLSPQNSSSLSPSPVLLPSKTCVHWLWDKRSSKPWALQAFILLYFWYWTHSVKTQRTPGPGTSLVAQWLRLYLPVQGIWVPPLAWEDPTCCRAAEPVCHNYWALSSEPTHCNYWSQRALEPTLHKRSRCNEKPAHCH